MGIVLMLVTWHVLCDFSRHEKIRATSHTRLRARDQSLQAPHSWKRRSQTKFASHYAWGTNAVCECKMDVKSTWIPTWHRMDHVSWLHGYMDYFQKPPLGGRLYTKLEDHSTPNTHNRWFILFYHVWGPTWMKIYWNSIWLRTQSHMTSHYVHLRIHNHTTWFWRCVGTTFEHFLLGSHNIYVPKLFICKIN